MYPKSIRTTTFHIHRGGRGEDGVHYIGGVGGGRGDPVSYDPGYIRIYIQYGKYEKMIYPIHLSKGKCGYPWESILTMYAIMYLLYMAYVRQYG